MNSNLMSKALKLNINVVSPEYILSYSFTCPVYC